MRPDWRDALERARSVVHSRVATLLPEAAPAAPASPANIQLYPDPISSVVPLGPLYRVGQTVTWREGRTRRPVRGVIREVHDVEGWPPEYSIRVLRQDGSPAVRITRRHQSELSLAEEYSND